jgi:hypothetical protein
MMVPALVIGKGGSNNNEGCSNKINNKDDGRFDSCLGALRGDSSTTVSNLIDFLPSGGNYLRSSA